MHATVLTVTKFLFMREPVRDRERLQHIIEASDFIIEHTEGVNFETFLSDKLLYGALIYYTMVIGEASYKLSQQFTSKFNDIPWADITGMRHHIVHGYYRVDNQVVWNILTKDIPDLRTRIQHYLDEIDWAQWESFSKE